MRPIPSIASTLLLLAIGCVAPIIAAEPATHEAEHESAHGGCLNAIGTCENGHAEVKIEGTTLRLWFVGGGTATKTSVRVPDASITLSAADPTGGATQSIVLTAKPLVLAQEKAGDCSYFEGSAPWLAGLKTLHATGTTTFRGALAKLVIDWPAGFDPDDEPAATPAPGAAPAAKP